MWIRYRKVKVSMLSKVKVSMYCLSWKLIDVLFVKGSKMRPLLVILII